MIHNARHWFTPHKSNNFRSKLLHNSGLIFLIATLIVFNSVTRLLRISGLHILGFTSTITVDEVVSSTNQERASQGLPPLKISQKLSSAAAAKAADMFTDNYWAHVAPDGTSPWTFIIQAAYSYQHAGENLAKDFSNTPSMINAWMASPTHRANIVSDKYTDIGVAVVQGNLLGEDTVLVVQMFGTPSSGGGNVAATSTSDQVPQTTPEIAEVTTKEEIPTTDAVKTAEILEVNQEKVLEPIASPAPQPTWLAQNFARFNTFNLKKGTSMITTFFFILILLLDLILAESKRLSRRVGKNWAHIIFANVILIAITIMNAGHIL